MEEFTITKDHLKLLQRMYVEWDNSYYGSPLINCKRPYGNSDVLLDIAEILEWDIDDDSGLTSNQWNIAERLHKETKTALQICLITGRFETGTFEKRDRYCDRSWQKIETDEL